MKINLKINNETHRLNVVVALVVAGYTVTIKEVVQKRPYAVDYYVHVEGEDAFPIAEE
jgi:hypothetical protein